MGAGPAEADYIIENLSVEYQLVVDPFLGSYGGIGYFTYDLIVGLSVQR